MAKVTGIGGVFFKARDPDALKAWYVKCLGVEITEWGCAILDWNADVESTGAKGATVWQLEKQDGDWFAPSTANMMINYRVDDMDGILARLAKEGVEPVKGPDDEFNGRFAWVMDPEGNKVELWEPKDPE